VAAAAIPFAGYLRTLAPDVLFGDSAELQTLAWTLGFAHTGYPIYLLLGKAFVTLVPFGTVAWRVNLMSAVFAAGACFCVFLAVRALSGRSLSALLAALALAFSNTFWSQAIIAEVYALHALLLAAILWLIIRWHRDGQRRSLDVAAVLFGLGLGHHLTMMLLGPALGLFALLVRGSWKDGVPRALRLTGFALAGFAPALIYLVVAQMRPVPVDFMHAVILASPDTWNLTPEDLRSFWARFAFLYGGASFRGVALGGGSEITRYQLMAFPLRCLVQFWPLGLALIAAGLPRLWARSAIFWLFTGVGATLLVFNCTYGISDIEVYYIPIYLLGAIVLGLGADGVQAFAERRFSSRVTGIALVLLLAGANVALESPTARRLQEIPGRWPRNVRSTLEQAGVHPDLSFETRPRRIGESILSRLDRHAIVFANWERMYLILYLAVVERKRHDLLVQEAYPTGPNPLFSRYHLALIEECLGRRPIYFTFHPWELGTRYRFESTDEGLLFQVVGSGP